jgi:pimeloyl-ACP methyl ester carboxylesterase
MKRQLRVSAGGPYLHAEVAGNGPPLLMGHGMVCSCRMFDPLAPLLADAYQVIVFDFSGHGRSGPPPDAFDLDRLCAEYQHILDAMDIASAHILGFSMGGMAAMRLALAAPDRVQRLVLMNTSAEEQPFRERQLLKVLGALTTAIGIHPRSTELAMRLMFSDAFIRARPDIAGAWRHQAAAMSPTVVAKTTGLIANRESILDQLGRIEAPTLVIGSTLDAATPVKHAYRLAAALPHARLRVLPGVGHASPLEAPVTCASIIRSFLVQTDPAPGPSAFKVPSSVAL